MGTLSELPSLHNHRLNHTPSKLPSYRGTDLLAVQGPGHPGHEPALDAAVTALNKEHEQVVGHVRHLSDSATAAPSRSSLPAGRPLTFSGFATLSRGDSSSASSQPAASTATATARKRVPASHSRNGLRDSWKGPPPAMLTQGHGDNTSDWVAEQSTILPPTSFPTTIEKPTTDEAHLQQARAVNNPVIPPIRAFRSTRRSAEMNATHMRPPSMDGDNQEETNLRPSDGVDSVDSQRSSNREQEEPNSDDSDLFLKLAREDASMNTTSGGGPTRQYQIDPKSQPPQSTVFQSPSSRRRGADQESAVGSRPTDDRGTRSRALTYRSSARDIVAPLDDLNRSRHYGATNSRSTPTTPRDLANRETSPGSQVAYNGRRGSVPDAVPARTSSYRHSHLSYSTPRTYNSSPLVLQSADIRDTLETPRAVEGTESTVSTTAPSTVWDELEDLKSRIRRLELTGKLPATSGAAISRASNDRPPTATTTVTTISSSPKRGRGNSMSPTDVEAPQADAHPLLHAALAKSRSLLSPEVYRALETTASDALAIAAMMGTSGQPGRISSSQSTIGGGSGPVLDRQVRRKADSMCRSLTELCLALSEGQNAAAPNNEVALRPSSCDDQTITNAKLNEPQPPPVSTDLTRTKSSPRALSRLEARRSSLLAPTSLPNKRHAPFEASAPTQSSMAGRRTSLLLRSRRAGNDEPEDDDITGYRAPSRANTEILRSRNSPREYTSQHPMPDNRPSGIPSSLPRSRYASTTSLNNTGPPQVPPLPDLTSRRYLDRNTPERDTSSVVGRVIDDGRKSYIGHGFALGRTGSLSRRTRQQSVDLPGTPQHNSYQ